MLCGKIAQSKKSKDHYQFYLASEGTKKKKNKCVGFRKDISSKVRRETVQEIHQYKDIANTEGDSLYLSYLKLII